MLNLWINALTKPVETFTAEKGKAEIGKGAINYVIAGLIAGVVGFVMATFLSAFMGPAGLFGVGGGALGIITTPIMQVIGGLIGAGIVFIVAKVLGGKGSYTSLFYLSSLYAVPMAILSFIPIVNLLAALYALYLLFLVIKISQDLSDMKAILTIAIIIAIVVVVAFIAAVIFGAALLAGLGASGMMSGY